MIDDLFGSVLAAAVGIGVTVGILAAPRRRRALTPAAVTILAVLAGMSVLGNALVGPVDLSPLLFHLPIAALVMTVWCFWEIKPREAANG